MELRGGSEAKSGLRDIRYRPHKKRRQVGGTMDFKPYVPGLGQNQETPGWQYAGWVFLRNQKNKHD